MELYLKNTSTGLIPMTDDDYDNKVRLKIGEIYKVTVKKARNYELHKKYFALINCAWEHLKEEHNVFFKHNIKSFRKTVEMGAGHYDLLYSIKRKEWIEEPKSISFDNMDEFEFRELYQGAKDVLFSLFLRHVSQADFEKHLQDF